MSIETNNRFLVLKNLTGNIGVSEAENAADPTLLISVVTINIAIELHWYRIFLS